MLDPEYPEMSELFPLDISYSDAMRKASETGPNRRITPLPQGALSA